MYFGTELVVYASLKPILTVSISSSDQNRLTRFETDQNVILFDPMAYLCIDEICPNGDAVGSWYSDNGHLGPLGSARLKEPLTQLFQQLLQR